MYSPCPGKVFVDPARIKIMRMKRDINLNIEINLFDAVFVNNYRFVNGVRLVSTCDVSSCEVNSPEGHSTRVCLVRIGLFGI